MKKKDSRAKPARAALKVVGGPPAGAANGEGESGIDFESVRVLARIAAEFELAEIDVDRSGHVRIRRGGVAVESAAPAGTTGARPIALAPTPEVEGAAVAGTFISSPFVGTFYRAPSPETPVFVDVGQHVRKGQVVCIVEAMKLMNEIEAESEGKIAEILVQNGAHVEYGQHLFRLAKS